MITLGALTGPQRDNDIKSNIHIYVYIHTTHTHIHTHTHKHTHTHNTTHTHIHTHTHTHTHTTHTHTGPQRDNDIKSNRDENALEERCYPLAGDDGPESRCDTRPLQPLHDNLYSAGTG